MLTATDAAIFFSVFSIITLMIIYLPINDLGKDTFFAMYA